MLSFCFSLRLETRRDQMERSASISDERLKIESVGLGAESVIHDRHKLTKLIFTVLQKGQDMYYPRLGIQR